MSRRVLSRLMLTLTLVAVPTVTAAAGPATAAPASVLSVDVSRYTAETSPTQWGHIVEDINHSVEGGLNANLVRNSTMKENGANPPAYWSAATAGGGTGSIALDSSTPLNTANPAALRLDVGAAGPGARVGAANAGFYGVGLRPNTGYTASFFARTENYTGPLTVSLEGTDGTVRAEARTGATSSGWRQYQVNLTTSARTPVGKANRVVIGVPPGGSGARVWLNVVRVLPPTYGTSGLLRTDLMDKMAATRPGFWRVPGGNYLEGNTLATRFDWKRTIGAPADRPGHQNDAWGYFSTDQAGLKAYLDMAEQTGAEPLLGVFAGYTLNGTVVPREQLAPYVQDALDEIEYVIGDASTPWGARRAADGHPEPYRLSYVEIGNEDFFDRSGSYDGYRFAAFHDAIKARYPQLKTVATTPVTSRVPDVYDEHYYANDPAAFTAMARKYDGYNRRGPKVLVGEYAITNGVRGNPTGTLSGAIGEAGYMTGMVRNADVVVGASYAPALSSVDDFQWPTNLIGFDASTSYGSPSYYVQQMFGAGTGRYVLPAAMSNVDSSVSFVATRGTDGAVHVRVVNPTAAAVTSSVRLGGAASIGTAGTVSTLTGDPEARNTITAPTTVAPRTASFTAGPRFNRTFPAHSVTSFTVAVTGALNPALTTDRPTSFGVTTPGYTDRSLAVADGTGVTRPVTDASAGTERRGATFVPRTGLGDKACYSLESRLEPGRYLRATADHRVVSAAPDGSAAFARQATFCAAPGNAGDGISLRSAADPSRYLRHYANVLYTATSGGGEFFDAPANFAVDTTFAVAGPFWRSAVEVPAGPHSYVSTAPGTAGQVLRHYAYLAQVAPVTGSSPATDRQDATFTVVPGLADDSCTSFRSVNFPDRYLRHADYRVRLDAPGGGTFAEDATFCAQPGRNGQGVTWRSVNFPDRSLRQYNGAVWLAAEGGPLPADAAAGYADDTSWVTAAPLG